MCCLVTKSHMDRESQVKLPARHVGSKGPMLSQTQELSSAINDHPRSEPKTFPPGTAQGRKVE